MVKDALQETNTPGKKRKKKNGKHTLNDGRDKCVRKEKQRKKGKQTHQITEEPNTPGKNKQTGKQVDKCVEKRRKKGKK